MKTKRKALLLLGAAVVLVAGSIMGTMAYLTDTMEVTNSFSYGDINITLEEEEDSFHIVPGTTITKDPEITVLAGSEECWLFVEIEEVDWPTFDDVSMLTYEISTNDEDGLEWTQLTTTDGTIVYYIQGVDASASAVTVEILKDNTVTVNASLTKAQVETMADLSTQLNFTAYAVQAEAVGSDAAAAWSVATTNALPSTTT